MWNRRELLFGGSAWLVACRAGPPSPADDRALDTVLAAHATALPERARAGANHYPMAAEALAALGHADAIPAAWANPSSYAGELPRQRPIESTTDGRGDAARYGDWLDHFTRALAHADWRDVLDAAAARLAPGLLAAAGHGLLRTAHAARALAARDAPARRSELAAGLAYWSAHFTELRLAADEPPLTALHEALADAIAPDADAAAAADRAPSRSGANGANAGAAVARRAAANDAAPIRATAGHAPSGDAAPGRAAARRAVRIAGDDVGFAAVTPWLARVPVPAVAPWAATDAATALADDVHAAARAFHAVFANDRHRVWLLHAITAPAGVGLLLSHVRERTGRRLVGCARQASLALFRGFGTTVAEPPPVPSVVAPWPLLVARAAASGSVHTIKLIEALLRFDRPDDPLHRAVAAAWLAWH